MKQGHVIPILQAHDNVLSGAYYEVLKNLSIHQTQADTIAGSRSAERVIRRSIPGSDPSGDQGEDDCIVLVFRIGKECKGFTSELELNSQV